MSIKTQNRIERLQKLIAPGRKLQGHFGLATQSEADPDLYVLNFEGMDTAMTGAQVDDFHRAHPGILVVVTHPRWQKNKLQITVF